MIFYGVIEEIWELNYHSFTIPVFKCDWVESNHGVKVDDLSFTLVDLNRLGYKGDPFIMANQARQVFYVKDPLDSNFSVMLSTQPRNVGNEYDSDEYVLDEHNTCAQTLVDADVFDSMEVTIGSYARKDSDGIGLVKSFKVFTYYN